MFLKEAFDDLINVNNVKMEEKKSPYIDVHESIDTEIDNVEFYKKSEFDIYSLYEKEECVLDEPKNNSNNTNFTLIQDGMNFFFLSSQLFDSNTFVKFFLFFFFVLFFI
jgi:hypothetical protein